MASRRVYITLNDQKEKDGIIEVYLSQSYSEADAIKEAIYRLATNNIQQVQTGINSTDKVQILPEGNKKVKKGTKRDSSKKAQKGADNTDKDKKITNDSNLEQSAPINENKAQKGANDDIKLDLGQLSDEPVEVKQDDKDKVEELRQKKLKALKQFM